MTRPSPDALELAIEALQAQAELDQDFATFYTMTRHGEPLDADEREVFEGLKAKKARVVTLREAALARAFPKPALDQMVDAARGKVVKGS